VSAIPNHQVHRVTSLATRAHVAMTGAFGYELDPGSFTAAETKEVSQLNTWYKAHRAVLQFGDFYRLRSSADNLAASWMVVSPDRSQAVVFWFQILAQPNAPQTVLRLKGLSPEATYQVEGVVEGRWGGDELLGVGLRLPELAGDYQSLVLALKRVE
jgi:alpha-galactosidase